MAETVQVHRTMQNVCGSHKSILRVNNLNYSVLQIKKHHFCFLLYVPEK